MKRILISFLLIITLICSCPATVYASSFEDTVNDLYLSGASMGNLFRYILEELGVILNPSLWGTGSMNERFQEYMTEQAIISNSDEYLEYLKLHLPISQDEDGEIVYSADSEIVNNIYNFSQELIKENSGFFIQQTADYNAVIPYYADYFVTKQQMDAVRNYIAGSDSGKVFVLTNNVWNYTVDEVTYSKIYGLYEVDMNDKNFVFSKMSQYGYLHTLLYSSETWLDATKESKIIYITQEGTILENTASVLNSYSFHRHGVYGVNYYYYPNEQPPVVNNITNYKAITSCALVSNSPLMYRVYNSLDDMKQYSAGTRPYYVTSDYYNYDSTIDNSTTITQTDIDNSITYGDIYNYIIYNYDNPDGLTEDELIAILEKYFGDSDDDNDDDDDDGDDDDNDDDDGGGLLDFLDGLGSIGDALLAILGKLMEYIGKAIELLTGTVTKIIDIIPTNIVALFSAMFPFFPEEWLVAIELLFVLTLIGAIWGIFKK